MKTSVLISVITLLLVACSDSEEWLMDDTIMPPEGPYTAYTAAKDGIRFLVVQEGGILYIKSLKLIFRSTWAKETGLSSFILPESYPITTNSEGVPEYSIFYSESQTGLQLYIDGKFRIGKCTYGNLEFLYGDASVIAERFVGERNSW